MQEGLLPAKITDRFLAFVLDVVPFMVGYHVSLYVLIVQLGHFPNTTAVWRAIRSMLPMLLNMLHIDPAVATSPIVTTSVDLLGLLAFFGLAAHHLVAG